VYILCSLFVEHFFQIDIRSRTRWWIQVFPLYQILLVIFYYEYSIVSEFTYTTTVYTSHSFIDDKAIFLQFIVIVDTYMYSVSQQSSHSQNFSQYFHLWWTCVTENYLCYCPNIFLCLHDFDPFNRIFVWIVSLLIVRPSNFNNSFEFITKFVKFSLKTSHIKWYLIKYNN